ncbi:MAG TPA: DUF1176 domain-containing protein [Bosea sp. (in: a-proteobacteria)]|jgi:hypothetical protein|uniref:DUF1176 domain-containing protein n=1 Tax=Bosea sp. (in: a-proteobacteria) TaxID=1871050 RepID=UPI002DDCB187|nr:DUF1176 domain-containing protein [Bosea sp. (in: a-proteobacteria)]HEV2552861.1 DUF1176 domain-containing protein [Bosea sp. (in: a-proteobacteria)]
MRRGAGSNGALAALGLMLVLATPAQAQIGPIKTFRDWISGCDNTKSCTALSLPNETDDEIAFLRLDRPAGPEGAPTLALKLRAQKLKPSFTIALALDGAPFPAAGRPLQATSVDGEVAEITIPPAEAEALIAAARKATTLTAQIEAASFKVSLAGSVAAMLWIDERQGRLNTPGALIRKGTTGTAPPAPTLPVIAGKPASGKPLSKAEAAALTKAMRAEVNRREPDTCEDMPDGFTGSDGAWALDDAVRLVAIACSRGAYNVASQFWLVGGRDVARARPAPFQGAGGNPANELINADFDPKTGHVSFYARARGIGDCGRSGAYGWDGKGFAVLRMSEMSECRLIPGDDWITLFRSKNSPAN